MLQRTQVLLDAADARTKVVEALEDAVVVGGVARIGGLAGEVVVDEEEDGDEDEELVGGYVVGEAGDHVAEQAEPIDERDAGEVFGSRHFGVGGGVVVGVAIVVVVVGRGRGYFERDNCKCPWALLSPRRKALGS